MSASHKLPPTRLFKTTGGRIIPFDLVYINYIKLEKGGGCKA